MVGIGETDDEVVETLRDLRSAGVDIVTIGQYLRPTPKHHEVMRYVTPETFAEFEAKALAMGFRLRGLGPARALELQRRRGVRPLVPAARRPHEARASNPARRGPLRRRADGRASASSRLANCEPRADACSRPRREPRTCASQRWAESRTEPNHWTASQAARTTLASYRTSPTRIDVAMIEALDDRPRRFATISVRRIVLGSRSRSTARRTSHVGCGRKPAREGCPRVERTVGGRPTRRRRAPSSASRRRRTARARSPTKHRSRPVSILSGRAVRSHRRGRRTWSPTPTACSTIGARSVRAGGHRGVRRRGRRAARSRPPRAISAISSRKTVSRSASTCSAATITSANTSARCCASPVLLAHVSGGVSDAERDVLGKLAADASSSTPSEVGCGARCAVKSGASLIPSTSARARPPSTRTVGRSPMTLAAVIPTKHHAKSQRRARARRHPRHARRRHPRSRARSRHQPTPSRLALYRRWSRVRILDERLVALQRQGRIGFHVGSLGEEAAIIGSAFAMRAAGLDLPLLPRVRRRAAGAGCRCRATSTTCSATPTTRRKGRQMPDHYTLARRRTSRSISSPVGTQITQAVGFAWAAKIKKRRRSSTLVYFGDGATSSNEFHSGMNFAGVFKVPSVFFCRNNGWAISVPTERQTASATFAEKGVAYGMPGVRVDGNDLFAVVKVTREARRARRARRGPDADRGASPTACAATRPATIPKAYRPADEARAVAPPRPASRACAATSSARGLWTTPTGQGARGRASTPSSSGHRGRRDDRRRPRSSRCSRTSTPSRPGTCASSATSSCGRPRRPRAEDRHPLDARQLEVTRRPTCRR